MAPQACCGHRFRNKNSLAEYCIFVTMTIINGIPVGCGYRHCHNYISLVKKFSNLFSLILLTIFRINEG